jgi:hypothetical protein
MIYCAEANLFPGGVILTMPARFRGRLRGEFTVKVNPPGERENFSGEACYLEANTNWRLPSTSIVSKSLLMP